MKNLINRNGITIKELKELVKNLPEKDEYGEDFELWVTNTDDGMLSNVATKITRLNKGDLIVGSRTDQQSKPKDNDVDLVEVLEYVVNTNPKMNGKKQAEQALAKAKIKEG